MLIRSRRDFLKTAVQSVSAAGALGALGTFGEMNALAAGSGYQALVCIYLAGGNDPRFIPGLLVGEVLTVLGMLIFGVSVAREFLRPRT